MDTHFSQPKLSYRTLPRRTVIDKSDDLKGKDKGVFTYGIMATVPESGTWLMVRIRHSSAYSYILHGSYQPVHLHDLLRSITRDEYNSLVDIVSSEQPMETFTKWYKITFTPNSPFSDYACKRLMDVKEDILEFDLVDTLPVLCNYSFPKGRKAIGETNALEAALREFREETGLQEKGTIIPEFLEYETVGHGGRYYTIRCWIMHFQSLIDLQGVNPIDTAEISKCEWIQYDIQTQPRALTTLYPIGKTLDDKTVRMEREVMYLCQDAMKKGLL